MGLGMKKESKKNSASTNTTNKKALWRLVFISILVALCLFGTAGTVAWMNGWIFLISYIIVLIALTGLVFHSSPELVQERMTAASKAKPWDRFIMPILSTVLPLLAVILAGLDHRFRWTHDFGIATMFIALAVMIGGNALTIWAMRVNRFFSSHVRIQSDRGHYVISNGPYRWVRHPGYTGSIIYNLAAPVLLCSFPALAVGVVFTLLMVVRTSLEDTTLRTELAGYEAYIEKTHWRLLPYIW